MGRTKISLMAGTSLLVALGASPRRLHAAGGGAQAADRGRDGAGHPQAAGSVRPHRGEEQRYTRLRHQGLSGVGRLCGRQAQASRLPGPAAAVRVPVLPGDRHPHTGAVSPSPRTYTAGTEFATGTYSGEGDVTGRLVPTNDILIPPPAEPGSTSGCEAADFPTPPAAELDRADPAWHLHFRRRRECGSGWLWRGHHLQRGPGRPPRTCSSAHSGQPADNPGARPLLCARRGAVQPAQAGPGHGPASLSSAIAEDPHDTRM